VQVNVSRIYNHFHQDYLLPSPLNQVRILQLVTQGLPLLLSWQQELQLGLGGPEGE